MKLKLYPDNRKCWKAYTCLLRRQFILILLQNCVQIGCLETYEFRCLLVFWKLPKIMYFIMVSSFNLLILVQSKTCHGHYKVRSIYNYWLMCIKRNSHLKSYRAFFLNTDLYIGPIYWPVKWSNRSLISLMNQWVH